MKNLSVLLAMMIWVSGIALVPQANFTGRVIGAVFPPYSYYVFCERIIQVYFPKLLPGV